MALTQLIISMVIWGTLGLFVLKSGLSSLHIAFFRCLIGSVLLIPFCWYKGDFKQSFLKLSLVTPLLVAGVLIILNWILLFESFHFANITLGNISYYLQPVFLVFLSRFFFREEISFFKYFLIFMTFIGVLLTVNISTDMLISNSRELVGVGFAILAGLLYSIATLIVKRNSQISATLTTLLQLIIGVVILFPFLDNGNINYNLTTSIYLLIFGFIHTVIAFVFYYNAVVTLSTDKIAVASYIDPITAIGTDVLFYHQTLNLMQYIGILITLLSSYMVINPKPLLKIVNKMNRNYKVV